MSKIVYRPKSSPNRADSKDEFELCYIRHKYFRKTLHNPSPDDMKPYEKIIERFSRKTYYTYRKLFHAVGFELEDIVNIGNIHLVSFLGLFSLESVPKKYSEFAILYKNLNGKKVATSDILNKNKANFTLFLKQRMEDVVRICSQKEKNITVADKKVDFSGLGLDPYDSIHNMNPEQILFHRDEDEYWQSKKKNFKRKPKDDRIKIVSDFVKNNSDNPKFEEEVRIAERYLKRLGI